MVKKNKVVLIIEDDIPILKILQDKFKTSGYTVITAQDGKDGLKKAKENKPDIILLDLVMPIMDGLTALEKLRKDKWGKNAKVIILSNLESRDKAKEGKKFGVTKYLVKANLKVGEVVKSVDEYLKKGK